MLDLIQGFTICVEKIFDIKNNALDSYTALRNYMSQIKLY